MVLNKKKAFNQIILKQLKNNCFLIYKSEFPMVCINHLMCIKLYLKNFKSCNMIVVVYVDTQTFLIVRPKLKLNSGPCVQSKQLL